MRKAWESVTDDLGLRTVVTFSGFMSQQACAERLKCADVLVLPSLFECGGAVVLEAMAIGLPVIATALGQASLRLCSTKVAEFLLPPIHVRHLSRALPPA